MPCDHARQAINVALCRETLPSGRPHHANVHYFTVRRAQVNDQVFIIRYAFLPRFYIFRNYGLT